MPRGDGTGPGGMGPMTGRAAGYCAGYPVPGFMNPIPGGGYGLGASPYAGYGAPMASPYAGYGAPMAAPYTGYGAPMGSPYAQAGPGFGSMPYGAGYPAWGAGFGYRPRLGLGRGRAWGGRGRRFW